MKLSKILYITIFAIVFVAVGCSSSGSGDDDNPPPPTGGNDDDPVIPDPSAATLVFPEDETECNTGVVDAVDETMSTVTFEWNASQNTDSYSVTVTNINTGSSTFANSTTNSADITIERGAPFSWFVISRAQGTTATAESATFRFYNEGPGIENYAPFPAEVVNPARGITLPDTTTSVTLEWSGSDIDNDIVEYEVLFGTDPDALTSAGTTTDAMLADVAVTSGTTYYWRIVTTDSAGNTSTSELFEFRIG